MKQTLLLLLALICINAKAGIAPTPLITMTTAKADGGSITIFMAATADDTPVQIDFGNGTLTNHTIQSGGTTINGTPVGLKTIKIYGSGIIKFSCEAQQLTAIDVSSNTILEELNVSNNQLTSLDVTLNTALTNLICFGNQLPTLNVTNNTSLDHLHCGENQLTTLNLNSNTGLTVLKCYMNQLSSLDVSNNTALKYLICNSNNLTSIDLQQNTKLEQFQCANNKLTTVDVSKNILLQTIMLSSNQITTLDISHNQQLLNLYINNNSLTSLNTDNNPNLYTLSIPHNNITALNLSNNTNLYGLYCYENNIASLDISHNANINYLDCCDNLLSTLDILKQTSLKELYCKGNNLTSIDLSTNTQLYWLMCYNCKFNFATLPLKKQEWSNYLYAPQKDYTISAQTPINTSIDLSSQLTVDGNTTSYIWKKEDGTALTAGTDYTINNGITTFSSIPAQKVYCEMTNATFPNLTLKTTLTTITLATGVDNNEMDNVEIYARQQTVYLNLPQAAVVEVYDITGHKIKEEFMNSGNQSFEMAQKGIYVVKTNVNNKGIAQKIVIK